MGPWMLVNLEMDVWALVGQRNISGCIISMLVMETADDYE